MRQKWTIYMFKYFSLFGFHAMPLLRIGGEYVKFVILSMQLAVCSWYFFDVVTNFRLLTTIMDYLDALNMFSYSTTCILTFMLIIYDSCANRNAQNEFGRNLMEAHVKYFPKMDILNWNYLITLTILSIGAFLDLLFALLHYDDKFNQISYSLIQYHIFIIYDNRIFYYLLHLRVICVQLQKIESELRFMRKQTFNHDKLKWIQDYYKLIYDMCEHVNTIFGLSQLALILSIFQSSITILNSSFSLNKKKIEFLNYGSFMFFFFFFTC